MVIKNFIYLYSYFILAVVLFIVVNQAFASRFDFSKCANSNQYATSDNTLDTCSNLCMAEEDDPAICEALRLSFVEYNLASASKYRKFDFEKCLRAKNNDAQACLQQCRSQSSAKNLHLCKQLEKSMQQTASVTGHSSSSSVLSSSSSSAAPVSASSSVLSSSKANQHKQSHKRKEAMSSDSAPTPLKTIKFDMSGCISGYMDFIEMSFEIAQKTCLADCDKATHKLLECRRLMLQVLQTSEGTAANPMDLSENNEKDKDGNGCATDMSALSSSSSLTSLSPLLKSAEKAASKSKKAKRSEVPSREEKGRGLANIGNTCFLNTAIKHILSNPSMVGCIKREAQRANRRKIKKSTFHRYQIYKALDKISDQLLAGRQVNENTMYDFYRKLDATGSWGLDLGSQHEMHEAYSQLMMIMEECNNAFNMGLYSKLEQAEDRPEYDAHNTAVANEVALTIPPRAIGKNAPETSVIGLLRNYFTTKEKIDLKYQTSNGEQGDKVYKTMKLKALPAYLTFRITRENTVLKFDNNNRPQMVEREYQKWDPVRKKMVRSTMLVQDSVIVKDPTIYKIPEQLSSTSIGLSDLTPANYRLASFSCHNGGKNNTTFGGHWEEIISNPTTGRWEFHSDSYVSSYATLADLLKVHEECSSGSSMFTYEKIK